MLMICHYCSACNYVARSCVSLPMVSSRDFLRNYCRQVVVQHVKSYMISATYVGTYVALFQVGTVEYTFQCIKAGVEGGGGGYLGIRIQKKSFLPL